MKRLLVPQEDNEKLYYPGKKSLYWSSVDTNSMHEKIKACFKKWPIFFDGGKYSSDAVTTGTKKAIGKHLQTACGLLFCPHSTCWGWFNKRCLECAGPKLCGTLLRWLPQPLHTHPQSSDSSWCTQHLCSYQHCSIRQPASRQKIPSLLE